MKFVVCYLVSLYESSNSTAHFFTDAVDREGALKQFLLSDPVRIMDFIIIPYIRDKFEGNVSEHLKILRDDIFRCIDICSRSDIKQPLIQKSIDDEIQKSIDKLASYIKSFYDPIFNYFIKNNRYLKIIPVTDGFEDHHF